MKKFITLMLVFAFALSMFSCNKPGKTSDSTSGSATDSQSSTSGSLEDWVGTLGGKKYHFPKESTDFELYDDATITQENDGIRFSGTGGFWDDEEGNSGAGAGGMYNVAINAKDGFAIEFTINKIGRLNSAQQHGGMWDSWIAFQISDKPKQFNTRTNAPDHANGIVGLIIPFVQVTDGNTAGVVTYDFGANWAYRGDHNYAGTLETKHTLEMKKTEDEWGITYSVWFDGNSLGSCGELTDKRFNALFPDGKVYLGIFMENWNASPKLADTEQEKTYMKDTFTVHSITYDSTKINFAK